MWVLMVIVSVIGKSCITDIQQLIEQDTIEALKALYYSGRDIDDLGKYENCIKETELKYALLSVKFDVGNIFLGLCVPKACSSEELRIFFAGLVQKTGLENQIRTSEIKIYSPSEYSSAPMPLSAMIALAVLAIPLILTCFGTFLSSSYLSKMSDDSPLVIVLKEFSLHKNVEKLVNIPDKRDTLSSIHGLKTICIFSILIYHTFNTFPRSAIGEPNEVRSMYMDFTHKFYILLRQGVGIFFIVSGFLLSYITLPELYQKKSNYNWKLFIIRRILRLTPVYYFALIIDVFLLRYIGSGPQWPLQAFRNFEGCRDYWWSNFLYLQDLVPFSSFSCMSWSWYVSCDLQFFMISPIILYLYSRNKLHGYICCAILVIANFLYIGILSQYYGFTPRYYQGFTDQFQAALLTVKPMAWVYSFLIGIAIGFLYRSHVNRINYKQTVMIGGDDREEISHKNRYADRFEKLCLKIADHKICRYFFYILGVFMMLASELYPYELDKYGNDHWSQSFKSFFLAIQCFMFGLGFTFWFLPILLGHCQIVSKFLSMGIFFPLAKLTFATYLIHPMIIELVVFSSYQRTIIGDFNIVLTGISAFTISTLIAAIIFLTVELPVLTLERYLTRQ